MVPSVVNLVLVSVLVGMPGRCLPAVLVVFLW